MLNEYAAAIVAIATIGGLAGFMLLIASNPIAPVAPYVRQAPRKHIRITYWTFDVSVSYYGENGRKLTTRRYATRDIVRIKNMARAAGYQAF